MTRLVFALPRSATQPATGGGWFAVQDDGALPAGIQVGDYVRFFVPGEEDRHEGLVTSAGPSSSPGDHGWNRRFRVRYAVRGTDVYDVVEARQLLSVRPHDGDARRLMRDRGHRGLRGLDGLDGEITRGDRVCMKRDHWTGIGRRCGTVIAPPAGANEYTLVRFDDGVIVSVRADALEATRSRVSVVWPPMARR